MTDDKKSNYCTRCDNLVKLPHDCIAFPFGDPVKIMSDEMDKACAEFKDSKEYQDALKEGLEAVAKASIVGKQESLSDFDKAKVGYDKINVYEREIWNAAIEAAALQAEQMARELRGLKK